MNYPALDTEIKDLLLNGGVIPAHPLALTSGRTLDEKHQRALTRYYVASGAIGVAVGVHSTQFEIRNPGVNLLEPVLQLADEESRLVKNSSFIKIAGICGPEPRAVEEAGLAVKHGYHLGLVSMSGLNNYSEKQLLTRTEQIARVIPVFGFYLQPAVGGRVLSCEFWREFVKIPNVYAIKIAPFNRYQTLDVIRAVAESDRANDIALYTGNDDNIVNDLLTTFRFMVNGNFVEKRFAGGLLGQWGVWTSKAVTLFHEINELEDHIPSRLLTLNAELTDANAAIFDASHNFKGVIPGIHEVLRRQGLLQGRWCLDSSEELSPGQMEEIDRVYKTYPHLNDDKFVQENLKTFLEA